MSLSFQICPLIPGGSYKLQTRLGRASIAEGFVSLKVERLHIILLVTTTTCIKYIKWEKAK